ncbi:chromosome-associated kinesin KIF4-like [Orussus abietinus]|uniref:chromosome-associated kinesin KIF4-like n=1 Tax=Orussus abietinus TaxID=222816 RepID=UPI000625C495|nr:chromosome-associated kinesin KIF4-like [Orussus abietinus]
MGCSCKGYCQSKQCGCVKKNSSCNDSCKCNKSACHNQNDTQNVNLVKKRTKSQISKSVERPLNEQINNKNAEHLYSPNSLENMFDKFSDLDFKNITIKINVESPSSSDSDNVFTPNKDLNKENEFHVQTKGVGVQTRRRGKMLSVPSEDKRQVRSSLNTFDFFL